MNTAMNDHIAQFVKGAHILSAAAVLTLLIAAIPSIKLFTIPATPVQTQIVGPVSLSLPELTALRNDVDGIKNDIQKLSTSKVSQKDFRMLGDKVGELQVKLSALRRTNRIMRTNKGTQKAYPEH